MDTTDIKQTYLKAESAFIWFVWRVLKRIGSFFVNGYKEKGAAFVLLILVSPAFLMACCFIWALFFELLSFLFFGHGF